VARHEGYEETRKKHIPKESFRQTSQFPGSPVHIASDESTLQIGTTSDRLIRERSGTAADTGGTILDEAMSTTSRQAQKSAVIHNPQVSVVSV